MSNQPALPSRPDLGANIPWLDGVRGTAIFTVALTHIFSDFYFSKIGWVGLNLFFILSGYLITRCLFQYQSFSTQGYFRNFYARRILRIFPLYYGVLILFFFLIPALNLEVGSGLSDIQGYYWFYASNWNMVLNGLPQQPLFFHFWSLAVEEQFYLLWPVLFLVFRSSRSRYILISLILVSSIVLRIVTKESLHAYVSSLTAAEPLLLGCLVCILQQDGLLKRFAGAFKMAGILSIIFLAFIFYGNPDFSITNGLLMKYGYTAIDLALLGVFCTALTGGASGQLSVAIFSTGWLRWLGKYSYSIYVFHWIVLQLFVYRIESEMVNGIGSEAAYYVARCSGMVLTLVLSYFSYHYYEKHFLLLKKHFTTDSRRAWSFSPGQLVQKLPRPARH